MRQIFVGILILMCVFMLGTPLRSPKISWELPTPIG